MCSVIGSFSKDKIIELCELNAYRGQHSHSISYYNPDVNDFKEVNRFTGPVNYDAIKIPEGYYCIVHMQAPTTENKNSKTIHPAKIGSSLLWHNGIIKNKECARLRHEYQLSSTWDTYLLLHYVNVEQTPKGIDGTFSCLWYDGSRLHLFRNEISPMFIDTEFNISSTKFKNSIATEPNTMLLFDPKEKKTTPIAHFDTVENPYYFGEVG